MGRFAESPVRRGLFAGLTVALTLAVLCGWLAVRVHRDSQADQFRARLVQSAKQGAVNLTTVDYRQADADVQRILDSASGEFYDDFKNRSGPFIDVVKKVRSTSVGTVTEAGLESADADGGQVLVTVTVTSTKDGEEDQRPRHWRMRMTVGRDGDAIKVAKVDFVS